MLLSTEAFSMPDFSMKQVTLFPIFDLDEEEKAILGRFLALLDRSGVSRMLPEKSHGKVMAIAFAAAGRATTRLRFSRRSSSGSPSGTRP